MLMPRLISPVLLKQAIGRLPDVALPPTARKEQPMDLGEPVKKILSSYESDNPGTKANLARILLQGKLGGTGRLLILPVDQGVEHGPARSFAPNPPAYDPHYHYQLAIEAGLSAYAAPLGFLEAGADTFAGRIPTILKIYQGKD
jgi:fructose-bisphosphate aldolase, class I